MHLASQASVSHSMSCSKEERAAEAINGLSAFSPQDQDRHIDVFMKYFMERDDEDIKINDRGKSLVALKKKKQ